MQFFLLAPLFLVAMFPIAQPQSEWREFTSKEGRFSASMPGNAATSMVATNTAKGTLLTYITSTNDKDLNEYLVSWTEYSQNSIEQRATEKTFDRMRDALVRTKSGTVLSESAVNFQNYPARLVTFSLPNDRLVKVRFCFVKNRVYQILAETRKEDAGAAEKFLDSFTLLPGWPI
ncbi:MAG TPA: hypothetical protein VGN90_06615 [Pyrinomonadaceae bacterium]|nr:hypothetical protein [Pyrinomonadaceae bacterium]